MSKSTEATAKPTFRPYQPRAATARHLAAAERLAHEQPTADDVAGAAPPVTPAGQTPEQPPQAQAA